MAPSFPRSNPTVTWQSRIDNASSEREIVSITRDFMAQFSPNEIASIPDRCRPGKIMDANDVGSFAFELARNDCHGDGESAMAKVSAFFKSAQQRLSELLGSRQDGNDGDGDSRESA